MAALRPILRYEVKVISWHAKRTRICWGPKTDKRAFDIAKVKFQFCFRSVQEAITLRDRMHCTCMNGVKEAVDAQSEKKIFRTTMGIAGQNNVPQTRNLANLKGCIFAVLRYGGERDEKVIRATQYGSRSLIYHAVENDHLTIEPCKSTDAKVTVFQEN